MVKGISRQVIVVHAPDPKLFEQAIFILKDGQAAVTDEVLLREARRIIGEPGIARKRNFYVNATVWASAGAFATGLVWLLTALL